MKKSLVVLLHVGYWGCYLAMIMVMLGMFFRGEDTPDAKIGEAFEIVFFFALFPSAITFYACYFFIFPKYLQQKKYLLTAVYELGISLVAAILGYSILAMVAGEDCVDDGEEGILFGAILFMAFVALISGVIAMVMRGFITWFDEIKLKSELQQKNNEMEMALVKSKLDPHFLFNTINNIDVLILKNADQASSYLNQLSDIMRFMLYETKSDKIPLFKEIEYIKKYIELQKIRTSNLSYVNFNLVGNSNRKIIAPMIFIPFIENAFKHNNNKKLEDAITINIYIKAENINFECINKFDSNRKSDEESNGLGNHLIQKRLNLLYPNKHTLNVKNENNLYSVFLTIENE